MDAQTKNQKRTLIEIDGWSLYKWKTFNGWITPYSIFHRCGVKGAYYVIKRNGTYVCERCEHVAPDGIVAVYEFMNWEAFGYGG